MEMHNSVVNVLVKHDYYTDGFSKAFNYKLNYQSTRLFHNADAIFKTHSYGFEILATTQTLNIFRDLVDEYEKDVIEVESKNNEKTEGEEKDEMPVPPAIIVKAYDLDKCFTQLTTHTIRPNSTCYFLSNVSAQMTNAPFLHENKYVEKGNSIALEHHVLSPWIERKDWFNTPVIFFCFYLFDILAQLNTTQRNDRRLNYAISFRAKQNIWKYLVFGASKYQELTINDLDNKVNFQFDGTEVVGGEKSLVYISKEPVKIQEALNKRFQLRARVKEMETVLIKRLPVASTAQISSKTLNGKQTVVSEIFVNL